MNLKEEIDFYCEHKVTSREDWLELFKKWALEMVGEEEEMLDQYSGNTDYWLEENEQRRLNNKEKQIIRQRIERFN